MSVMSDDYCSHLSIKDADDYFDIVKKLILDKQYHRAAEGLEFLVHSVTTGVLAYSEERFEAYKNLVLLLIPYARWFDEDASKESELLFTCELLFVKDILRFINENRKDFVGAQEYAKRLIEAAILVPDGVFLRDMVYLWCDLHEKSPRPSDGIPFLCEIFERSKQLNDTTVSKMASSLYAPVFIAVDLIEYIRECDQLAAIDYGKKIIDWYFFTQLPQIKRFVEKNSNICNDALKRDLESEIKWLEENSKLRDREKQVEAASLRIVQLKGDLNNGFDGVLQYCLTCCTSDVVIIALDIITCMNSSGKHDEAKAYLKNIYGRLVEHGLTRLADGLKKLAIEYPKTEYEQVIFEAKYDIECCASYSLPLVQL